MEKELENYLLLRDIPAETLHIMKHEKISMDTIKLMEPEALQKFIPKIGDRLAILDFCSRETNLKNKMKGSLLEKLRSKLKNNKPHVDSQSINPNQNKVSATKLTRIIDIGWINFENGRLIQVRARQGGGTRKVSINKDASRGDILTIGKNLFFVDGVSRKGHASEYNFTLCDFQFEEITDDSTVAEMYKVTGFTNLRFYITTHRKKKESMVVSNIASLEPVTENVSNLNNCLTKNLPDQLKDNDILDGNEISILKNLGSKIGVDESFYSLPEHVNEIIYNRNDTINQTCQEVIQIVHLPCEESSNADIDSSMFTIVNDDIGENIFNGNQDAAPTIVILHRGNMLDELVVQFIPLHVKSNIQLEIYLPNGEQEKAQDVGGVFRDVLSEFWEEFVNKLTVGTHAKVPILRHDFDGVKWTAVAKILAKGLLEENYLPIQLSKSFIECCIFGETKSNLTEDLLKYVSTMDSEIISAALQNFNEVDYSELLECLESLDCKLQPKEENIDKLIKDLAHKEIVQKPMFIINHWYSILENIISSKQLEEIYDRQKNLPKNILKILDFDEIKQEAQKITAGYLKRFVREGDEKLLSNFLRYVTGANIIIGKRITVSFVETTDLFSRTPVAHTCNCSIALPYNYESYPDFRNEFQSVLNSNIWVMDIM